MDNRKIQFASPAGKIGWIILGILAVIGMVYGYVALIILSFLFTALFWFGLFHSLARTKKDADVPFSTVRAATQGYVKLKGHIDGDASPAPLSQEDCVFWELRVSRYSRSPSAAKRGWNEIARVQSADDYVTLNDKTGLCLLPINADGWELSENKSQEFHEASGIGDLAERFDPEIRARLQSEARWRVDEYCIKPTDTVYATGLFKTVTADKTPYDDTSLDRQEQMGDAAPAFSKWVVEDFGQAYRASITKSQHAWKNYVTHQLLGGSDTKDPVRLDEQMVNTLISDFEGKQYMPVTVTNRRPRAQKKTERNIKLMQFFFGWFWLGVAALVTLGHYPETFYAILDMLKNLGA